MDKIDSLGDLFTNKSLQKKTRKKKTPSVGAFSTLLHSAAETEETQEFQYDGGSPGEPLQNLLTEVTSLGDALVKTPTLDNVRRYREGIRHFMKYLVDHVLAVEEKTSGANILKRKKYLVIMTVDQKLEALAREFLAGQKTQIDRAGRINEINGLLVDLLR
jgi:uncharacterized protein YaaR (DUF327 family)